MHEAIRMSATDPNTGLIDLDLINTGAGQAERRLGTDLKCEVMKGLDSAGGRGMRWTEAAGQLQNRSWVRIEAEVCTTAVRDLADERLVKVVGERDKRVIHKITND